MKGDANQLAYLRRLHGCLAAAVGSPEADAADMTESESSSLRGLPGPRRGSAAASTARFAAMSFAVY